MIFLCLGQQFAPPPSQPPIWSREDSPSKGPILCQCAVFFYLHSMLTCYQYLLASSIFNAMLAQESGKGVVVYQ